MSLLKAGTVSWFYALCLLIASAPVPGTASASQRQLIVAITDIKAGSGCDTRDAARMTAQVRADLESSGGLNVMDRSTADSILGAGGVDPADTCGTATCLIRNGGILGADVIVAGSMGRMGSTWWLDIRAIRLNHGNAPVRKSVDATGSFAEFLLKSSQVTLAIANEIRVGSREQTATPAGPGMPMYVTQTSPASSSGEGTAGTIRPAPRRTQPVDSKNKNRTGISAAYLFYPGSPLRDTGSGPYYDLWDSTATVSRVEATFYIAVGPFINITITPACTYIQKVKPDVMENGITMISASPGAMFVKRWYPVKINAGAALDFNWLFYNEKNFLPDGKQTNYSMGGFSPGIAGTVGGEYLIIPNLGIGADVVFRYTEMAVSDWVPIIGHKTFNIRMPWLGFRFGAAVYF